MMVTKIPPHVEMFAGNQAPVLYNPTKKFFKVGNYLLHLRRVWQCLGNLRETKDPSLIWQRYCKSYIYKHVFTDMIF